MSEIAPRRSTKLHKSSPSPIDAETRRNYVNALLAGLFWTSAAIGKCSTLEGNIGDWSISGGGAMIYRGPNLRAPKKVPH